MTPELEPSHTSLIYSIFVLGLTLVTSLVSLLVYKVVIYPLYRMNFYKKQGAACLYYPLIGHFGPASKALKEHGDLKYLIKNESKTNPSKYMCTNLGFDACFVLHDPAMIKEFYLNTDNYIKDPIFLEMYSGLLGKGLITSEGSKWKTQRKILSNAFHFEFFRSIFPIIKDTVHENLYNLRKDSLKNVNLLDAFQSITGQIIGKTFFGDQLNKHDFEGKPLTIGLDSLIGQVGKLSLSIERYLLGATIIQKGVFKRHRVLMQRIQDFRKICKTIIEERKEFYAKGGKSKSVKDLLDLLLEYNGEEGRMSEDEIIDQFISFFLAGMDTTGHVVTVAEYYLQTYPEYRARMLAEVQKHYNIDVSLEELNKLEFTMAFIKEILRMMTPAPALIPRRVMKDHMLQDIKIRKGDLINIEYFYNHFSSEYFDDPETFNPDRWLNKQKNFDAYAFTPFSAGPRNCIGQHMALIEARVILAEYLTMYESKLKEGYELKMSLRFLYEPVDMIEVDLTPKYE